MDVHPHYLSSVQKALSNAHALLTPPVVAAHSSSSTTVTVGRPLKPFALKFASVCLEEDARDSNTRVLCVLV